MWKRRLPIVLGAVVLLGAIGLVWVWKPPRSEEEIARLALERVRENRAKLGREEGRDYTLDPPRVVRRDDGEMIVAVAIRGTEENRLEYYQLSRRDGTWQVDRDLFLHFELFVKEEMSELTRRLYQRLAERFQAAPELKESPRVGFQIVDEQGGILGKISLEFVERGGPGLYVEYFRYEKGSWISEGSGQLFDTPPRR
ncbi:MAG: hypothetical protein HY716_00715 [Planctomycetes bacterium]|nr:hypothetical protein [Planctomycetota bacterium]